MLEGGWAQAGGLPDSPGLCCGAGPGGGAALAKSGPPASGSAGTLPLAAWGAGRALADVAAAQAQAPVTGASGGRPPWALLRPRSPDVARGAGPHGSLCPFPARSLPAGSACLARSPTTRPGQLHTRRPVCRLLFCLPRAGRPWGLSMGVCEPGSQGSGVTLGLRGGPLGARGSPADLTRSRV